MIEVNFDVRRQQFWFYDDVGWCHTQWISPELRSVPPHTAYLPPSCSARGCLATINYVLNPGWSAAEEFVRTSTPRPNSVGIRWPKSGKIFQFLNSGGVFLEKVFWEKSTGREDCHYQASCKTIVWFQELHSVHFPKNDNKLIHLLAAL